MFKVGDRVRRVKGEWYGMQAGDIDEVIEVNNSARTVKLKKFANALHDVDNLVLASTAVSTPDNTLPPPPLPSISLGRIIPTNKPQYTGIGGLSSIGPLEQPAPPRIDISQFADVKCECGASSVGVEKHGDKCPRLAWEHMIQVKQ